MEININRQSMEDYPLMAVAEAVTEETMDAIVPDSCPDAERVCGCRATVMLRSKEAGAGRAIVAGSAKAYVVYESPDGDCRSMPMTLPFTAEVYDPAITQESILAVQPKIISAEGKVVNSRKLQLKTVIAVKLMVFGKRTLEFCTEMDSGCPLEILDTEASICLMLEPREKNFTFSDQLQLDGGRASAQEIMLTGADLTLTDKKLVGNKLIVKGTAAIPMVFKSPEGTLDSQEFSMPFSQILDFEGAEEGDELWAWPSLTSFDLEIADDYTENLNRFDLSMGILIQAAVCRQSLQRPVVDFYSTQYPTSSQTGELRYTSMLDRSSATQTVHEQLQTRQPPSRVLSVSLGLPKGEQSVKAGKLNIKQPIEAAVTYLTASGGMDTDKKRLEASIFTDMSELCDARIDCSWSALRAEPTGSGVALELPMSFDIMSTIENSLPVITEATAGEEPVDKRSMPSAVLLKNPTDSLWQLGKNHLARIDDIIAVNGLTDPGGRLDGRPLLIPKA